VCRLRPARRWWLYGTIHDAGRGEVSPGAWHALDSAAVFVSEFGDAELDPQRLAAIARLPWGRGLDQLLPADDWWELATALLGAMSEDELRHARPWFALVKLRSRMGQSPTPSMDVAMAEHGRARQIAVAALESWEDQLTALDAGVSERVPTDRQAAPVMGQAELREDGTAEAKAAAIVRTDVRGWLGSRLV